MDIRNFKKRKGANKLMYVIGLLVISFFLPQNAFAHCDSYDGPVIQDALKALNQNKIGLVYKWISEDQEEEISDLFQKALKYREKDREVYQLLEKHFLETLVRLHREGEGEPFTGLKPAGNTKPIIRLTDTALEEGDFKDFISKLNGHIEKVVREKYETVAHLKKTKDESVEKGRAYVAAYVDYTHTVERMHDILEHANAGHVAHQQKEAKNHH